MGAEAPTSLTPSRCEIISVVFEAVTFGVTLYQRRGTPRAEDSLYCTSLWLRPASSHSFYWLRSRCECQDPSRGQTQASVCGQVEGHTQAVGSRGGRRRGRGAWGQVRELTRSQPQLRPGQQPMVTASEADTAILLSWGASRVDPHCRDALNTPPRCFSCLLTSRLLLLA